MKQKPRLQFFSFEIGTDILWLSIILLGILFITSIVPLVPNDFWWHIKIGEWIFTHKTIPTTNMYAWTLPADTPFVYGTWLGELLLYIIFRVGGLESTIFIRNLLLGLAFLLLGLEAKYHSGSWRIAAFTIALGFFMTMSNLQVRTQIWSWIPFMIYLILLRRYVDRKLSRYWLLILPILMVFWVNTHGAYILGIILTGIYLASETFRSVLKQSGALKTFGILWLALINLLTGLAILLNPRSVKIFGYVLDLMTDQPSQQLVVEWQSPTPHGLNNSVFFISLLLLIVLLAYSKYSPSISELLLCVSFIWLAWSGVRYIVWYAMVTMPIIAKLISWLPLRPLSLQPIRNKFNTLLVLIIMIPVLLVQPWFVEKVPLPKTYTEQVLRDVSVGPLLSTNTPVQAVEYLQLHPGGNLFNEMGFGSYLIWAYPEQGVFVDPRVELFPWQVWKDYQSISAGFDYNQLLDYYGVDRLLLSTDLQLDLINKLIDDDAWLLEYQDPYSQIWTKANSQIH